LDVEARPGERRSFEGSSDIGNRMNDTGGLQGTSDTIQQVRNTGDKQLGDSESGLLMGLLPAWLLAELNTLKHIPQITKYAQH
jgi:hypothetical protein